MSSSSARAPPTPAPIIDLLANPRYSQANYLGRVQNFFSVIDPRTLLTSEADIKQSVSLIEQYKKGKTQGVTQEQIWQARKIKDSCVHPDTGDIIFPLARFSAFVPVNIPLVIGMLGSQGTLGVMFWQWANQSYNVVVNYANRNIGAKSMSNEAIAASYAGAVFSSCSIAVGLGAVVKKLNERPNPGFGIKLFRGAVPFFAVASAGVVNVGLMRRQEAIDGIPVKDAEGVERGVSVKAGQQAILEVAMTRVALPAPILLFPPILMSLYDRTSIAISKPTWRPFVQVPVITACLWLALPLAIGLFPQLSSVKADDLEPQFRDLKDSKGEKVKTFYFNKGL